MTQAVELEIVVRYSSQMTTGPGFTHDKHGIEIVNGDHREAYFCVAPSV
jgi:hypothetical protein